jgi:tyrosyl-tRNA synthetase
MNFSQVIQLASRYTVARLLERDDFEKRLAAGKPIGLHELLYPLIQGYDSVVLKSDIELCGTDQIFNCLVARTLQEEAGIEPETIIAMPLLEGLDGVQKMSKSLGNSIGITEPPQDMFGKIMSLPDSLLEKYLELVAGYSVADLAEQKKRLQDPATNPRDLKLQLAMRLVAFFYNQPEAERVRSEFQRIFSDRSLPEDMPEYKLDPDLASAGISIMTLLMETKLVPSRSEAQRMIEQGAIKLNQNRIQDFKSNIRLNHGDVLQLGKRKFVKIVF